MSGPVRLGANSTLRLAGSEMADPSFGATMKRAIARLRGSDSHVQRSRHDRQIARHLDEQDRIAAMTGREHRRRRDGRGRDEDTMASGTASEPVVAERQWRGARSPASGTRDRPPRPPPATAAPTATQIQVLPWWPSPSDGARCRRAAPRTQRPPWAAARQPAAGSDESSISGGRSADRYGAARGGAAARSGASGGGRSDGRAPLRDRDGVTSRRRDRRRGPASRSSPRSRRGWARPGTASRKPR